MAAPSGAPQACREFAEALQHLDPGEPLPEPLAHHLSGCPLCRRVSASEPARLFSILRGSSPEPAPAWDLFWQQAQARRASEAAERGTPRQQVARRGAVAAACTLILAASVWFLRAPAPAGGPGSRELAAEIPAAPESGAEPSVVAASLPTLESIASPAARVVDFKIFGASDQVTEVILIFDEGIDL